MKTLSFVAVGVPALPPPSLSVIFVTAFALDWSSAGRSAQRSPEFRRARSLEDLQPPTLVFVSFQMCLYRTSLVVSNVSPALPLPSARSSWLIPMMRYLGIVVSALRISHRRYATT